MADNLPPEEEQQMDDAGFYYEEPTTAFEAVHLVNFALSTLEMIDTEDEKLTEKGKQAIIKIKKQCLKLLSWGVQEMHDSIFDTE
jgi:lipid II:glycine glycyltransferase (peptidoglycan interpeptide bridge formation enzyme)